MELLQLKYFCDAAQTEKFSQTAKNFLVPVSNISQSVKRLEKELGAELFHHKGNKVILNNDGKQFYSYASRALSLLDDGKKSISESEDNLSGDIRLVCANNYKSVTVAIEKFLQKNPNVNFIIYQNSQMDSNFDILISDIFPRTHSRKILLFEDEILVAMSKNNPLSKKNIISVSDLEEERFIALNSSISLKKAITDACEKAGFLPKFTIQTYSTAFLRRYIEMGLGISFTPASWSKKYPEIAFRRIDGISKRKTYAFLPKDSYIKKAVAAFLEVLKVEAEAGGL